MSTTAPPPPPTFMSPTNTFPPPGKTVRAGARESLPNNVDGAGARRKAELGRLQDLQKHSAPVVNMARNQLGYPMPPNSHHAPPPPPVQNHMKPVTDGLMLPPGTATGSTGNLAPNMNASVSTNPSNLSRRLEESFPPFHRNENPQSNPTSPTRPPASRQTETRKLGSLRDVNNGAASAELTPARSPPPASTSIDRRQPTPYAAQLNGTPTRFSANEVPKSSPPINIDAQVKNGSALVASVSVAASELDKKVSSQPIPEKEITEQSVTQVSTKIKSHVSFHPSVAGSKMNTPVLVSAVANGTEKVEVSIKSKSNSNAGNTPAPKNDIMITETPFDQSLHINAGHTPFPEKGILSPNSDRMDGGTPSTSRREILATMRAYADTPPAKQWTAPGNLHTLESKKETPITPYLKQSPSGPSDQPSGAKDKKMVGFLSPVMNISSPAMGVGLSTPKSISKRCPTPYPKFSGEIVPQDHHFVKAAEAVPFEYESDYATFTIRRPFGLALEQDLWFSAGTLNAKAYAKNGDIAKPSTLDVVATIKSDNSLLAINGDCEVRHRQTFDNKWKEFGNIKDDDTTLGYVTYIDSDASEKQYLLDDICEGALSVREHYCSSILSTAEVIRKLSPTTPAPSIHETLSPMSVSAVEKSPMSDANVGTEDLLSAKGDLEVIKKETVAPSYDPPTESASEALSTAVGWFFSTIFRIIWFLVVRIPFMVLTHVIAIVLAVVVLSIIQMYVADDNGAAAIGSNIVFMPNAPGIF